MSQSVQSILNQSASSNINTSTASGKSELGKDDFLKLMIAQLRYQDPLNPMENTEYTAQLAQFTSLEQLTNMSKSLDNSVNANFQLVASINNTMTAAFIGKDVKLDGNSFTYKAQDEIQLGYNLGGNAHKVKVTVYNEAGVAVKVFDNMPGEGGDHKFSWDFTDSGGRSLAPGNYSFSVEATASNGEPISASYYKTGTINALRFTEAGTMLIVDGVEYPLGDIQEIYNPITEE